MLSNWMFTLLTCINAKNTQRVNPTPSPARPEPNKPLPGHPSRLQSTPLNQDTICSMQAGYCYPDRWIGRYLHTSYPQSLKEDLILNPNPPHTSMISSYYDMPHHYWLRPINFSYLILITPLLKILFDNTHRIYSKQKSLPQPLFSQPLAKKLWFERRLEQYSSIEHIVILNLPQMSLLTYLLEITKDFSMMTSEIVAISISH